MERPVKKMTDNELLAEANRNPFFARELPPGKEPPNFDDEVLHRQRVVREELQARGFTFENGGWQRLDTDFDP